MLKVGLIIDEFFGGAGTAFGGYGFLAREYISKYIPNEEIQVDVLLGKGSKKLCVEEYKIIMLPLIAYLGENGLQKDGLKKEITMFI